MKRIRENRAVGATALRTPLRRALACAAAVAAAFAAAPDRCGVPPKAN